jgi:hypothetical protein
LIDSITAWPICSSRQSCPAAIALLLLFRVHSLWIWSASNVHLLGNDVHEYAEYSSIPIDPIAIVETKCGKSNAALGRTDQLPPGA